MTAEKKVKVSAAAARYLAPSVPREERLAAASGEVVLTPADLVLVVYYLCHDRDPDVKGKAIATMRGMDAALVSQALADPALHPRVVDVLARLHYDKPELAPFFEAHPHLGSQTAAFLAQKGMFSTKEGDEVPASAAPRSAADAVETEQLADAAPVDEESEEFRSKYQLAQQMVVSEKIKAAMTGDKEWRTILIKDSNKLVSGAVVKNPRITESEVLAISKSAIQNDEIMRVICSNKEWMKNYQIRKALVFNHRTPIQAALRFLASFSEKDLASVAKSKNVSTTIATQARKFLLAKKEKR